MLLTFLASLYLRWVGGCETGSTRSGWTQFESATAGGLAVVLVLLLFGSHRLIFELAAGAAVYVNAAGFEVLRLDERLRVPDEIWRIDRLPS